MKNYYLKYSFVSILALSITFLSCEEKGVLPVEIPTAISFDLESDNVEVQPGGSSYELALQSTTVANMNRTYSISLNESSTGLASEFSLSSSSITIPAGELKGNTIITFNYDAIPLGVSRALNFDLNEITDGSLLNSSRASTTINYSAFCPNNEVVVTFTFDNYPEEAYWQLYDSSDNFLDGDGYSGNDCYVPLSTSTKVFCLENGDYQFLMGDCYGDGGTSYTISFGGNVLYSSSGISGTGEIITFSLP